MENKIEYQLSLESAEKLAVEQAMIQISAIRKNRWSFPIVLGILFALMTVTGIDVSKIAQGICAVIAFCFGFGGAYLFQSLVRTGISRRVRKQARIMQQKLGAARTASWDAESLVISSSMWRTQINWRVIDELVNGKIGIYLLCGRQVILGIPKEAIPQSILQDKLIKTWQSHLSKPPKLS